MNIFYKIYLDENIFQDYCKIILVIGTELAKILQNITVISVAEWQIPFCKKTFYI